MGTLNKESLYLIIAMVFAIIGLALLFNLDYSFPPGNYIEGLRTFLINVAISVPFFLGSTALTMIALKNMGR